VAPTAITKVILSLEDFEDNFGAVQVGDRAFFYEWQTDLPALSEADKHLLDQIRGRFRYQRKLGPVAEGLVNVIVVSPILGLAGFCDPPFRLKAEHSITIETIVPLDPEVANSEMRTLNGRIDFLVVQNRLWQAVIESKETTFDVETGVPQILSYMMQALSQQSMVFGMVTNGTHFVFVKLQRSTVIEYGFSNTFSTLSDTGQLYDVFQILKKLGGIVLNHVLTQVNPAT
jgi:hypothetical protein